MLVFTNPDSFLAVKVDDLSEAFQAAETMRQVYANIADREDLAVEVRDNAFSIAFGITLALTVMADAFANAKPLRQMALPTNFHRAIQ